MSAPNSSDEGELNRFREMINDWHDDALVRAGKEPNEVDVKIAHLYSELGPNARRFCNEVLAEWVNSEDGQRRFSAFSLARKFRISSMTPAIEEFIRHRSNPQNFAERGELAKAKRVLTCLTDNSADPETKEHPGD
jgi:hypothetical protein